MKSTINHITSNQLARNTFWMFLGQGLRTFIQAGCFILVARALGAQGYGSFIGVVALVGILAPFSSMGSGNLLIKNVARNASSFGICWGNALCMILISGTLLLVAVIALAQLVLPAAIPVSLVFAVAAADLFFSRLLDICGQAFQAFQHLGRTAMIQLLPSICKLTAVACLISYDRSPSPVQWGYLYLASTALSALIGIRLVHVELGRPLFHAAGIKDGFSEGFYFSVSLSAQGMYNDIDKTMLARLSTLEATGIYGVAYRIIDVTFIPVRSLMYAAHARFFQHGAAGVHGSIDFAKKLFPAAGCYGLLGSFALFAAAPLLSRILGPEYDDTVNAVRWLALLPFLKTVHYLAADALTGAGYQRVRSIMQLLVAGFNVAINLWLIPAYSWRGAAWASIASDTLLVILLCLIGLRISGKEPILATQHSALSG
ncbi:MAG: oligosaccharide flippase family protein [Geobacter sp.]|nr:oligosaccharide flippase family protein [Geobacter sp.]